MRTIVHLSDLHFGAINEGLVRPLAEFINDLSPNLVAVSGDLTQRARTSQFQEAQAFLSSLSHPQIIVPGNHDISLHNLYNRFFRPLEKFQRYISKDLQPFYQDEEIAVLGVNTARSWTIKGGRINRNQVDTILKRLGDARENAVKIVVSHHPFELPKGYSSRDLVGRSSMALERLADGVDIFLAGHLHISNTTQRSELKGVPGNAALLVQAGTAISHRVRRAGNSFNVIRVDQSQINIEKLIWDSSAEEFKVSLVERFQRTGATWSRVPQ